MRTNFLRVVTILTKRPTTLVRYMRLNKLCTTMRWLKKPDLSKDEKYVEEIVERYLSTNVEKVMNSSGEILILDRVNEVYISLHNSEVEISNHSFLYRKMFRLSFVEKLQQKVIKVMDQERADWKKQLFKNELDLLVKIKENIKI